MDGLVPSDILLHAVNVIITFALIRLILWKPLQRILSARRERVEKDLKAAANAKAEAEKMKADYEKNIADMESRGRDIIAEAQKKAFERSNTILAEAHDESEKLLAEAHTRIEEERRRAISSARADISALAGQLVSSVLRREVEASDDISAVERFFAQ